MVKHRHDLPALMKELGLPLIGAELGVAEGYFSNDLLDMGLKLYMVDAWATLPGRGDGSNPQSWHDRNFQEAMDRVRGKDYTVLRGRTVDMALQVPDNSLSLLYLDAGHWYKDVMEDLQAWFPKVVRGGIIAGHDYLSMQYGVNQAVNDFTRGKYKVYTIEENKPDDAGFMFIV